MRPWKDGYKTICENHYLEDWKESWSEQKARRRKQQMIELQLGNESGINNFNLFVWLNYIHNYFFVCKINQSSIEPTDLNGVQIYH